MTITALAAVVVAVVGGEGEARAGARAGSSDARSGSSRDTAAPAEAGRYRVAAEVQADGVTLKKRPT